MLHRCLPQQRHLYHCSTNKGAGTALEKETRAPNPCYHLRRSLRHQPLDPAPTNASPPSDQNKNSCPGTARDPHSLSSQQVWPVRVVLSLELQQAHPRPSHTTFNIRLAHTQTRETWSCLGGSYAVRCPSKTRDAKAIPPPPLDSSEKLCVVPHCCRQPCKTTKLHPASSLSAQ